MKLYFMENRVRTLWGVFPIWGVSPALDLMNPSPPGQIGMAMGET
jgi:hypothetical protein